MTTRNCLIAALLAACSIPASAQVFVLGTGSARSCFEAADSRALPGPVDLRQCEAALNDTARSGLAVIVATHVNRGVVLLRMGDVDGAISDFDRAIELDPDQPEAYLNKGAAMLRRDRAQEAIDLYTVALQHNTRRPAVAHYGRAIANEDLGNIRAAYHDYRTASRLDPSWAELRTELQRFQVITR